MRPWFQKRGYTLYRMKCRPEGDPPVHVPFCYVPSHEPVNEESAFPYAHFVNDISPHKDYPPYAFQLRVRLFFSFDQQFP